MRAIHLEKRLLEDKKSPETLHLSHSGGSEISSKPQKLKLSSRICFGVYEGRCPEWLYLLLAADTRHTVEDIEEALLKQLKASKETSIAVKKPEDENIRFYGNTVWT